MTEQIYFVAGVHGVGKTSLCQNLAIHTHLPHHSCSQMIRERKQHQKALSKIVSSEQIDSNQLALEDALYDLRFEKAMILDGGFSLLVEGQKPKPNPFDIFKSMSIETLFFLTCEPDVIVDRLLKRDGDYHSLNAVSSLQALETQRVYEYSEKFKVPVVEIDTTYGMDVGRVLKMIEETCSTCHSLAS